MTEDALYEATYILAADLEEEEIEQITGRLRETVEQAGAEFVADHLLGRRQLAYEIDDHSTGIYRVMYFKGGGEAVNELKNEVRMNESIIRSIVVVANPDAIYKPTAPPEQLAELEEEQAASEAEEPEAVQEAEAAPVAEEPASETDEREAEAASEVEEPEAVQEAEAAPVAEEPVAETNEPEAETTSEAEEPEAEATDAELETDD